MGDTSIPVLSTAELAGWIARLGGLHAGVDDAERVEQLGLLEALKAAAAAAQARVSVAFADSQRAAQLAAGVARERAGAGIAEQVALARRGSPTHGHRHLGLAHALVGEMPHTMAALAAGELSEWRATLLVRATAVLDVEDRRAVDARLAGRLAGLSDRAVDAAARAIAYELDPHSVVNRASNATRDRRVSIRPAPDTMAYLTALLPVHEAVAAYAALTRNADTTRAAGDPRTRAQIAADTFVERLTGQTTAAEVPIEIQLIMTDTALLGRESATPRVPGNASGESVTTPRRHADARAGSVTTARQPRLRAGLGPPDEPPTRSRPERVSAHLVGIGPVPSTHVRALLTDPAHAAAQVWVRRLFTDPATGQLAETDTRRRLFPAHLRTLLIARDHWCRTPWCGAPIRHLDHALGHADGGETTIDNGQGLCERCNHVKNTPGWTATARTDQTGRHAVTTHTPTGTAYTSTPPPALAG